MIKLTTLSRVKYVDANRIKILARLRLYHTNTVLRYVQRTCFSVPCPEHDCSHFLSTPTRARNARMNSHSSAVKRDNKIIMHLWTNNGRMVMVMRVENTPSIADTMSKWTGLTVNSTKNIFCNIVTKKMWDDDIV